MAQTLSTLSTMAFVIAVICLIIAIFFWFFFKIPTVIGDLSGRTARKSIAKIRQSNERSGNKSYQASKINIERGTITKAIKDDDKPDTGILKENIADKIMSETTELLNNDIEFKENKLLKEDDHLHNQSDLKKNGIKLNMIDDVVLIHTSQIIE